MSNSKIKLIKMVADSNEGAAKTIKAGIYARYSSLGNSPYSADEQIQRIRYRVNSGSVRSRRYPNAKIEIDESWVLKDEAMTGRTSGRDGYEMIKSGITNRAFDMVLMDDISRMSRDMGDTLDLYEALEYASVEGFSIADSISTVDPNARDLFIFKGYANEHQSKSTSKNTIRGLEIRAINGYSTGHNPYGYFSSPTKLSMIGGIEKPSHFEIKIQHDQAQIVVRIWTMYAEGEGCHSIATTLNTEGVPAPARGKAKNGTKRWSEKMVWLILRQQKYVGIWMYRQTKVVKNPTTVRLVQKERPKEEWLVTERQDLRIIPKDLEDRVKIRQSQTKETRTSSQSQQSNFELRGNTPKYLFIGSLKCAECGGNFILVSGKCGGYLGCWNAHRVTVNQCQNKRTIQMSWVESHILDELKKQLDRPETYNIIANRYNEIMKSKTTSIPQKLIQIDLSLAEHSRKIENFTKFIEQGNFSDTIKRALSDSEAKLKTLQKERDFYESQVQGRVYITPMAIREKMRSLDEILEKKRAEANGLLRRLFPEKITMAPDKKNPRGYLASGALNLFSLVKFRNYAVGVPYGI